ncbi:MAG TPA: HPr-rel-A system PqqD family peptide chaperone [Casimicrobiaceae bacterium]
MSENHDSTWRVVAPGALTVREWDDELVVYNDLDGNTHHLAPLGGKVLLALIAHPDGLNDETLIGRIGERLAIAEAHVLAPAIDEALDELGKLGLIAPLDA